MQSLQKADMSIPRCYKPSSFGHVASCQLHCFSDASERGYGVACYVRLADVNGNTLSLRLRSMNSYLNFKRVASNYIRPPRPPPWFYTGKIVPRKLHTRLRLNNSTLNSNLFTNGRSMEHMCSCGHRSETTMHFLLECEKYQDQRDVMLGIISDYMGPSVSPDHMTLRDKISVTELLLYGSSDISVNDNISVFHAVHDFIITSGRFARSPSSSAKE